MKQLKLILREFTQGELMLWGGSALLIVIVFFVFDRERYFTLAASLIGTTSLIFNAKGNLIGQILMIAFSLIYGMISFTISYYGETITYVGMTMPMAIVGFISWMKNPYNGNRSEVKVNHFHKKELVPMFMLTAVVTVVFYFILNYFHTANIVPSTLSVTTSFLAVYLTFKRSPYYAIAYAANDVVLIVLWSLAAAENMAYISMIICFLVFLVNDIYGFISWRKMEKRQAEE